MEGQGKGRKTLPPVMLWASIWADKWKSREMTGHKMWIEIFFPALRCRKQKHKAEFPQTTKKSGLQLDRHRYGCILPSQPSFMFSSAIILILWPFSVALISSAAWNAEMRRRGRTFGCTTSSSATTATWCGSWTAIYNRKISLFGLGIIGYIFWSERRGKTNSLESNEWKKSWLYRDGKKVWWLRCLGILSVHMAYRSTLEIS